MTKQIALPFPPLLSNLSLSAKRCPLLLPYCSAFQPVRKVKAVESKEEVVRVEEDSVRKGSICLSEGTENTKNLRKDEAETSVSSKKLRRSKENAVKCRSKKKALIKYFNQKILSIEQEEKDLLLKVQGYKELADKIRHKSDYTKRKGNLASIDNIQLKGQLLILQEKYRQTESFVMSLIFSGGVSNDMKLL
eukprot:TRINITY_DN3230_c0_g4_i3.p1 TRINITY_DN3230_c0_g4~~TRINITY_DN3230_c0_g4_i3.p1  ORF type:complete len:192 (+),score=50.98 TRINITY_DN3230_c0_g4_i3:189-764(+)